MSEGLNMSSGTEKRSLFMKRTGMEGSISTGFTLSGAEGRTNPFRPEEKSGSTYSCTILFAFGLFLQRGRFNALAGRQKEAY